MTADAVTGDHRRGEPVAAHGEARPLTAGVGPVAVRVFPGLAEEVPQARRWVRALAAAAAPGNADLMDDLELIAAELFANAVLHTRSGSAGGKVTVAVTADWVLHVHDHGTGGGCAGLSAAPAAEGEPRADFGRGLAVAAAFSTGLAHLPAAWCPLAGPDDPAAQAGGCCTCCRPASLPPAPTIPAQPADSQPALSATREESTLR